MQAVYDDMQLYVTGDRIFIEPVSPNTKVIVIDRVSHDITVQDNTGQIPSGVSPKHIYGVLGVISLLAGPYLVVVTGKSRVGTIAGQEIWKLDSAEMICFHRTLTHLTDTQERMNKVYISMVESVLATPYFYFSYTYDLTHSQQRLHNTSPEFLKQKSTNSKEIVSDVKRTKSNSANQKLLSEMPLYIRADPRFLWNGHLLRQLPDNPGLGKFLLPVMHGFISINSCSINGKPFTWSIVSRRSCNRAGTRLFMRGIDKNGNVANFVETEQIVESSGDRCSFIQTRGSIPLFWQQLPNLKYKPRPALIPTENHMEAFVKHFEAQIMDYDRQVLVNLVDHRGSEGEIEEAYKNMVNRVANPEIRYESFDFHHECRKMRWDRLSVLIDRLAHEQDEFGYFLLLRDGTLAAQQTGVFRTNCIDCLDRTNVVQSMLARRSLTTVLQRLAILRPGQTVEQQEQFEWLFKSVWADNADVISTQYSGTGALKTDFTRTGKRTYLGALHDLSNSVTRYYKNNFMDGFRQDSIDLFLGNYRVSSKECVTVQCPLAVNRGWKYITFPMIFCVAVAMFFANVITPTEYSTGTLLCLLFWGSMISATGATILYYGREFVDYPCLREITYTPQSQP